jgi:hypothetical protein
MKTFNLFPFTAMRPVDIIDTQQFMFTIYEYFTMFDHASG